MDILNELLASKNFELPFQELFQIKHKFINPIKEIRLNSNHYNPHDLFPITTKLNEFHIIDLQYKIIIGKVQNNVYTILDFK